MNEIASLQHTLQVVSFMAGGYRFAVEAAWVRSQLPATKRDTATSAEQLLGLPEGEDAGSCRILVIKHPTVDYSMRVSEPVTLGELSLVDLHPLPDLLAARSALNGICALSTGSGGITVLIDLGAINQNVDGTGK